MPATERRLLDVLRAGEWHGFVGRTALQSLRHPWCWPAAAELANRAAQVVDAPAAPAPGETVIASVPDRGRGATLWRLSPQRAARSPGEASFVNEARRTLQQANSHALRVLPALRSPRAIRSGEWCAMRIVRHAQRTSESVLDGSSFGLSMCLAAASRLLGTPISTTVAASCTIDSRGHTGGVRGLDDKVALIAREALGVTRLLVHPDQVAEAQRGARRFRDDLVVCAIARMGDAMEHAFPRLTEQIASWWTDDDEARRAAGELFRCTIEGQTILLDWKPLAAAAARLEYLLQGDPESRRKAAYARNVARRHGNEPEALDWPDDAWLRSLRRPLRQLLVAQTVQSAIDAGKADTLALAARALAALPREGDEHPEDLAILGAVGRAFAGYQRYAEAVPVLARAVEAWFDLGRYPESSHALCELLRIEGILAIETRPSPTLDGLIQTRALRVLEDPDLSRLSAAFIRAAIERALVLAGESQRALALEVTFALEPLDWLVEAPRFLAISRGRWVARGLAAVGRGHAAAALREGLWSSCEGAPELREFALLAATDHALERGDRTDDLVAEMRLLPSFATVSVGDLPTHEIARRYADHCRY